MLAVARANQPPHSLGAHLEAGAAVQDGAATLAVEQQIPEFDPKIHLNFIPPKARYSFTGLGLEKPHNAPDMCYTEPFQLFSEEGVRVMRRELFRKEFLDKYMRVWNRAPCYIAGHTTDEGVSEVSHVYGCTHTELFIFRKPTLSNRRGITRLLKQPSTRLLAQLSNRFPVTVMLDT